ncbi:MAG: cytochrome C oxidase Cbb3, partial [Candidatus Dadabacteria bacterium]|nr:cytochrome C oxidase Cbb3 [Candidatus Dadabacteria bacterium]
MADFTSSFWSYFIIILTVLSIIVCFVIIHIFNKDRNKDQSETTGHIWDEDLKELNNPMPNWWLNLFYITLVFGIVYLILYPGLGSYEG